MYTAQICTGTSKSYKKVGVSRRSRAGALDEAMRALRGKYGKLKYRILDENGKAVYVRKIERKEPRPAPVGYLIAKSAS